MSNLNTHSTNNVVYYIGVKGDDHVKIGTTKNLTARLKSLSTARADGDRLVVLATEPGTYDLEQKRHAQFAGSRVHGEWFTLTPELQEHIDRLALRVNPAYIRGYDEGYQTALADKVTSQAVDCDMCGSDQPLIDTRDKDGYDDWTCRECFRSDASIEGYQFGHQHGQQVGYELAMGIRPATADSEIWGKA